MKIYLINNGGELTWDEHVGFVIAARSANRVREILAERFLFSAERIEFWVKQEVLYLGEAQPNVTEGIVLESFNAG